MRLRASAPLLALAALGALACSRRQAPSADQGARQTIEDLELSQATRGQKDWRISSRLAVLREGEAEASLSEPRMEFFSKGRLASRARARSGLVLTDTQDVVLSSAVVVRSLEDGSVLETEELRYSSKDRRFRTDKPILARRPGGVLRGRGLEATPDLSEIRIFHQESVLEGKPR